MPNIFVRFQIVFLYSLCRIPVVLRASVDQLIHPPDNRVKDEVHDALLSEQRFSVSGNRLYRPKWGICAILQQVAPHVYG